MKHTIYFPKSSNTSSPMLFCIPLLIGMLAGSVWYSGHYGEVSPLLHQYFSSRLCGDTVSCVFKETFVNSSIILILCFVFGLCAVGQPLILALPLYRGFGIGLSAAIDYAESGSSVLPEVLLMLAPQAVAASAVAYIAVRESLRTSNTLMKSVYTAESPDKPVLKLYCIRFSVLLFISAVIALAKALLGYILSGIV